MTTKHGVKPRHNKLDLCQLTYKYGFKEVCFGKAVILNQAGACKPVLSAGPEKVLRPGLGQAGRQTSERRGLVSLFSGSLCPDRAALRRGLGGRASLGVYGCAAAQPPFFSSHYVEIVLADDSS